MQEGGKMYLSHKSNKIQRRENTFLVKSVFSLSHPSLNELVICVTTITREMHFFGAFLYGTHFFICGLGWKMSREDTKKVTDISGIELTPAKPDVCLGNGEQGFECCCDECDHYLLCFPEFDSKSKKEKT